MTSMALDVLLVEDDPGDRLMIAEALKDHAPTHTLHCVSDGVEAMGFLRRDGEYADRPRPDFVILDLNLPRKDGREVLAEMKGDPSLRRIPVIVFTTSQAHEDIHRSYDLHANAYVTKPVDFDCFVEAVRNTDHFFANVAKLPRQR